MFDTIKKELFFKRTQLLLKKGKSEKRIIPFNDDFFEKLSHTYINGIPVAMHIKYLKPKLPPGRCYDRSLYMFYCFDNAILVRGNNKDLEYKYGKENTEHGWIEIDDYVYDPTLMMRFDKDLYYEIYKPTIISKCTKKEYCSSTERKRLYDYITGTKIEDYKPQGEKRKSLATAIPLYQAIAKYSNNPEFEKELDDYLQQIQYDEAEVCKELVESVQKAKKLPFRLKNNNKK